MRFPAERGHSEAGIGLRGVLIWVAAIAAILVLAMPEYLHGIHHRNEAAAIVQIRTIQQAEETFFSKHKRFAGGLRELGGAGLNRNEGYLFTLSGGGDKYSINGTPVWFNLTGRFCFYSDESRVIHENWGAAPATVLSRTLEPSPAATQ